MKWHDINKSQPKVGQNVIAVGTWEGEVYGRGDDGYMGIGTWTGNHVDIDADTYYVWITDVTHWQPLPGWP